MPNLGFLPSFPIAAAIAVVIGVGIFVYQEYVANRNEFQPHGSNGGNSGSRQTYREDFDGM